MSIAWLKDHPKAYQYLYKLWANEEFIAKYMRAESAEVQADHLGTRMALMGTDVCVSHPKILISECEPFSHKKLKIFKRIYLF
jgi:hypothetical protein